jgi:hypothetical protein
MAVIRHASLDVPGELPSRSGSVIGCPHWLSSQPERSAVRYGLLPVAGSNQNLSGLPYAAVVKATSASSKLGTGNSNFSLSVSLLCNRPASHRYATACTWEPRRLAPTTAGHMVDSLPDATRAYDGRFESAQAVGV